MSIELPSVAVIRTGLEQLSHAQMQRLARASGVPFTTIWKIRDGTTKNPGLETVGQFVPHIDRVVSENSTQLDARTTPIQHATPPTDHTLSQGV